jgi:hypothetical protein
MVRVMEFDYRNAMRLSIRQDSTILVASSYDYRPRDSGRRFTDAVFGPLIGDSKDIYLKFL